MKRIIISGDRHHKNAHDVTLVINKLIFEFGLFQLVHGDAKGVDTIADIIYQITAGHLAFPERHPADWDKYGRAAGHKRNQKMLDTGVDLVVALHRDLKNSRGTRGMVELAEGAGVEVRTPWGDNR